MVRSRTAGSRGPARKRRSTDPAQRLGRASEAPVTTAPHVLRDYAFLGDGHRGALLGPQGDCAWLCFPSWSDPAVFASLIGSGGQYLVQPTGRWVWGGCYDDGSLVWTSRWVTEDGIVESREALVYPGDADRAVLLRRVRAGDAGARVLAVLDPRADYGRRSVGAWHREGGCWRAAGHGLQVRWWGAPTARPHRTGGAERMEVELQLEPRTHHDLVLELVRDDGAGGGGRRATNDGGGDGPDADELWRATEEAWAREVPPCGEVVAARDVRRSYAVLRGMTGPGGGTVAAATTSLPERAESDRNYDYRYVWIRDTCYVGQAGAALPGGDAVLDDAVRFVVERLLADGGDLEPAYRHDGGPVPGVRKLDLPGYPGGTDVVGNGIGSQFQLDVFGEALLLLAAAAARDRLDPEGWRAARIAADTIGRRWHEPDAGLWELTPPRLWTASRLVCVAGLRALASSGAPPAWTSENVTLADAILAETSGAALHPSGRWQRTPEDDRVDAALLLAQIRGAVPPDDPRSGATRAAVAAELGQDEYVYRYAKPGRPLGDEEGAFLICSFWMSMASWAAGDRVGAVRWFERARTSAGSPGLLSEELDVAEHQLRGNLPQAFVHAALVEAAAHQRDP